MIDRLSPNEHRLFDAACSGRLDSAGHAELQQLLRESPAARRRYLDYAELHADLFGAVRVTRVRDRLATAISEEPPAAPERSRSPRRPAWPAAAFATAAILLLAFLLRSDHPPAEEHVAQQEDNAGETPGGSANDADFVGVWPGMVARVIRVEDVEWPSGGSVFAASDLVATGQSINLVSGIVEIEFRQGAVVVLEGPAHLIADNANGATLRSGKLAAVAPPWATGFRIDTPGVDVVDHGTEFAVNVTGDGSDAQVNVVVTEGEVEVLADQQVVGGRRLLAGEGVQSTDGDVRVGDDAAARRLTERLPDRPEMKNALVVGDRWADWTRGVEGEPCRDGPWRYYTNKSGKFGKTKSYDELVWDDAERCYLPVNHQAGRWIDQHVRVHRDGGHPGRGREQVWDKIDRYSITGFVVPEDGVYRVEAGWLERRWARRWDQDQVLDIAVHVNDQPVVMREFCNRDSFVAFRQALGKLSAGDTIYVGVGPNGTDFNDKFRWGFCVVRETDPRAAQPATGEADLAATD